MKSELGMENDTRRFRLTTGQSVQGAREGEPLQSSQLRSGRQEIKRLRTAMDIVSRPFPGHDLLTRRERVVLAQIVGGASSKEAGRALGISPRTVEFHRRNIMRKLGAANIADLLVTVLTDPAKP